jgi:hypothetical protein
MRILALGRGHGETERAFAVFMLITSSYDRIMFLRNYLTQLQRATSDSHAG